MTKKLLFIAMVLVILIAGAAFYINQQKETVLSPEEVADKAVNFINQTIEDDVTASLVEVTEEAGVYRIDLLISGMEYTSYVTKNGKLLFPNSFSLEE